MTLTQGCLEFELRNGSRAVVLAPAAFRLDSERSMSMQYGTAWFHITKKGQGFQLTTPELVATDLGTEFGILANGDVSDEVHVLKGSVHVRSLNGLKTEEILVAGQARVSDPAGRLKETPCRVGHFLTALPEHDGSSLTVNGGFESGNDPIDSHFGEAARSSLLPGWNYGSNIVVSLRRPNGEVGYGQDGIFVRSSTNDTQIGFNSDETGEEDSGESRIWQAFHTVPGEEYTVSFEMGGIFYTSGEVELTASVCDGADPFGESPLAQIVERRLSKQGSGYNPPVSFRFTASSESTLLAFVETSRKTNSIDPVLDNVSVVTAR